MDRILLGLLREPATGYELKAVFDRTINYFWPAELSQIYRTLKRLERESLLRSRIEPSPKGPDRKVYSLTGRGQEALQEWLSAEPEFSDERHTHLAQLFFMAELDDLERTLEFVESLRHKRAERLKVYHGIEAQLLETVGGSPDGMTDDQFHQYLTLRSGLHAMAARVAWCDEVIDLIKTRNGKRKKTRNLRTGRKT